MRSAKNWAVLERWVGTMTCQGAGDCSQAQGRPSDSLNSMSANRKADMRTHCRQRKVLDPRRPSPSRIRTFERVKNADVRPSYRCDPAAPVSELSQAKAGQKRHNPRFRRSRSRARRKNYSTRSLCTNLPPVQTYHMNGSKPITSPFSSNPISPITVLNCCARNT